MVKGFDFIKYYKKPLKDFKLASDDMSSFAREITLEAVSTNSSGRSTKSMELEKAISVRTVKQEESKINDQSSLGEM